jgi:hypothetical protein
VLIIRRINGIDTSGMCHSDHLVCRSFPTCILDGHLHRVTHTRCCIDTIDSPDDEHEVARNMYQLYQYNIWYVSLCVGDRLICRSGRTCILDGQIDTYQM